MATESAQSKPKSANANGTFVGREWLLEEMQEWLDQGGHRALLIGPPGIGKSRAGREFASRIPGSKLIDFSASTEGTGWPEELEKASKAKKPPTLLVLDALECAPAQVWRTSRLEFDFPETPKLLIFRPGVHFEAASIPGTRHIMIDPNCPRHSQDIAGYLSQNGLGSLAGLVQTFREAEFLVKDPQNGAVRLDQYYLALWRETTRPHTGAGRILLEQVGLLLADAPESLPLEAISDFTGVPLVQIREAIDDLSPLLGADPGGLTLFSHGLSSFLTRHFSRDLGPVHGRIVSFFRETYPSWQEMHDPYGWRYLVLHCDRLARASRRKDFSILHWLNEGSFSQLKLERTGMLPSVLKDLRLSLLASLETNDLPRVVSFGCRLARLRKHESIATVHRLADAGQLNMARDNAFLVSGESHRFLIWLLFATQTLEGNDIPSTATLLGEAATFPKLNLTEWEVDLAASMLGVMLTHPELNEEAGDRIQELLEMDGDPAKASQACKAVGRLTLLSKAQRVAYFERGLEWANKLPKGRFREMRSRELSVRLARLAPEKAPRVRPYPDVLSKSKNAEKSFSKLLKEVRDGSLPVATAAASLIPVSDQPWVAAAFLDLTKIMASQEEGDLKWHSLHGLLQSVEDADFKDVDDLVLAPLSIASLNLSCPELRSRYLARYAVVLTSKERPMDAQQRISLSAANAFSVVETEDRSLALLHLATMVSATGALGRARDLSYHALELKSRVEDLDRETRQLVRLMSTSGTVNQSADEIVRLGESLRFDNSPIEREAKGRALVTLAAGLARLGAEEQARAYREKAIETTRAIENAELRIHLLTDLAGALYSCEEKKEARRLVKEARAEYDESAKDRGLLSSVGLLRAYVIFENRTQTKKAFERCLQYLDANSFHEWLGSPAVLELLHLSQHLGKTETIVPHLEKARKAKSLSDEERLGLLRCELQLGDFEQAENHLSDLEELSARCQGGIDLALAILPFDDHRASPRFPWKMHAAKAFAGWPCSTAPRSAPPKWSESSGP